MAPKAPIGAAHMIIASTRKTSRWSTSTTRRIGLPASPMRWSAKPTSRATSSVCSTSPLVSEENSESGMMPSRNSVVLPWPSSAAAWPALAAASSMSRPSPGLMMLPTTRPMVSATVDMARK